MPFSKTAGACFAVLGLICAMPIAAGRSSMELPHVGSYTVELYVTALSGSQLKHSAITIARRSDGSRAEIHEQLVTGLSGERLMRKSIMFADGVYVDLRNDTHAKVTVTHDINSPEWISRVLDAIDPASDCQRNFHGKSWSPAPLTVEGHETIKSQDALRMRFTETNGDVVTEWRSPAFGCEVIQEDRVERNGTVEHQVPILLHLGEPQLWFFDVPGGYKEPNAQSTPP